MDFKRAKFASEIERNVCRTVMWSEKHLESYCFFNVIIDLKVEVVEYTHKRSISLKTQRTHLIMI